MRRNIPLELVGKVACARRRMKTADEENARHVVSSFSGVVFVGEEDVVKSKEHENGGA